MSQEIQHPRAVTKITFRDYELYGCPHCSKEVKMGKIVTQDNNGTHFLCSGCGKIYCVCWEGTSGVIAHPLSNLSAK